MRTTSTISKPRPVRPGLPSPPVAMPRPRYQASEALSQALPGASAKRARLAPLVMPPDDGTLVNFFLVGPGATVLFETLPPTLQAALQEGLPTAELLALQAAMQLPLYQMAGLLGISKATLYRRLGEGRMSPTESARLARYARLMGMATTVMGSAAAAREWLNTPRSALGHTLPLAMAQTEWGAKEVENLLGRIEYSIYS